MNTHKYTIYYIETCHLNSLKVFHSCQINNL